jgi:hypothetical protein
MFTWLMNRSAVDPQRVESWPTRDAAFFLAGGGVPTFRQSIPRITAELDRARRYQRALTFAIFSVDRAADPGATMFAAAPTGADGEWPGHAEVLPPGGGVLLSVVLACLLRETMRETDIVTYASTEGRCVVVMPEVDTAEARQALGRLHDLAASRLTSPVRAGIAVFPQDGLTLEELIRRADERAQRAVPGPHLVESDSGSTSLSFR